MSYRCNLLPKLRDQLVGQGMNEILPGLYIGNFRDSKDCKQLDVNRITHILSIHDDAKKLFKEKKYLIICAADSPKQDLTQYLPQCNDFIHAARLRGGHVLIHCLAGISRSVTIAAAYVTCVTSLNHQEALQVIRSSRKVANPNSGFQKQLADYEATGAVEKERQRLVEKFRPRHVVLAASSASSSPAHRRPGSAEMIPASPSTGATLSGAARCLPVATAVPGRLVIGMTLTSYEVNDSLAGDDEEKCRQLLDKYRNLVTKGDLCGGDCPNDGMTCLSGVCRAHNRTNTSFLRRGSRRKTSAPARQQGHINVWSIATEDQIRLQVTDQLKCKSQSQPTSPAPRNFRTFSTTSRRPTTATCGMRTNAKSDFDSPAQSPRHNTQPTSRPLFKVKSDSSLPSSPSQGRRSVLRHRVTVNSMDTSSPVHNNGSRQQSPSQTNKSQMKQSNNSSQVYAMQSNPSQVFGMQINSETQPQSPSRRSISAVNIIPGLAPLANIDEQSLDLDIDHMRIDDASNDQRRYQPEQQQQHRMLHDPPSVVLIDDHNKRTLSLTKISVNEKPTYLVEPHMRRNASWTTMTMSLK